MSAAVYRSPAAAAFQLPSWFAPAVPAEKDEDRPGQLDIWNSIQAEKKAKAAAASADGPPPYVHPLVRRSSSLMSQKSLEVCTEALGSESGSDVVGFSSFLSDNMACRSFTLETECTEKNLASESLLHEAAKTEDREAEAKELKSVNYHCSGSRRLPPRSFPPPLPSISRRDGQPCLKMRPHRRDGRLIVEAVPVPSHNYLHAQRQHGCLRLSFIDTSAAVQGTCRDQRGAVQVVEDPSNQESAALQAKQGEEKEVGNEQEEKNYDEEEELEEEEEEVEVVDRGTVIEVKVTTQPQQQSGGGSGTAAKVHRSSVVINKFVGGAPLTDQSAWSTHSTDESQKDDGKEEKIKNCHVGYTTTTAAAAVAAAATSSVGYDWCGKGSPLATGDGDGCEVATTEAKMLFTTTSRARRSKEELLRHMRRCNQLRRRPLFIWEPCCIATSS
ncbi:Protein FAF-like, chloroplastic [Ananas comosus]|uniref:Protein FAF-like, chloroplastic n=1 Tax=Ananas comosus TaxID=4615 RepID=A0A199V4U9_ANACO|nr:Protein FAF-like, chloroplastic [Ananas comosus]